MSGVFIGKSSCFYGTIKKPLSNFHIVVAVNTGYGDIPYTLAAGREPKAGRSTPRHRFPSIAILTVERRCFFSAWSIICQRRWALFGICAYCTKTLGYGNLLFLPCSAPFVWCLGHYWVSAALFWRHVTNYWSRICLGYKSVYPITN